MRKRRRESRTLSVSDGHVCIGVVRRYSPSLTIRVLLAYSNRRDFLLAASFGNGYQEGFVRRRVSRDDDLIRVLALDAPIRQAFGAGSGAFKRFRERSDKPGTKA